MKIILKNTSLVFATENSNFIKPFEAVDGRSLGYNTIYEGQANNRTYSYDVSDYKTVIISNISKEDGVIASGIRNGGTDHYIKVLAGLADNSVIDVSCIDTLYINIDTRLGDAEPIVTKGQLLENRLNFLNYTKTEGYITNSGEVISGGSSIITTFNVGAIQKVNLCVSNPISNGLVLLVGYKNGEMVSSIPMVNNNTDFSHIRYDIIYNVDVSAYDEIKVNNSSLFVGSAWM